MLDVETPQGRYAMRPAQLVDELTYRSYAWNRQLAPMTTPAEWAIVYGAATEALEQRYQAEQASV